MKLFISFDTDQKLFFCSVGDLDPVEVATGIFWWVATDNGSRSKKKTRSRPITGRDPKKNSGRDRPRVATRKKNPIATEVCGRDPVEKIFSFFFSFKNE
jgi:hypothetical protein